MLQKFLILSVLISLSLGSASAFLGEKDAATMLSGKSVIAASSDYRLSESITRKEMMKIVMNLSGKSVGASCTGMFSDVANDWGCKYIESALANGYIAKNATFRPNDTITKAESMKLIAQARGLTKVQSTTDWQDDWMMTGVKNSLVSASYTNHTAKATRGWIFSLGANPIKMMDTMMKDDAMMKKEGVYKSYDTKLLGMYENTVLFFHAPWCPSCKATDTNILANDIASENIAILKVDYDSATELKKKYGITMQHTFVQVDATGEMIQKWNGSNTLDAILEKVQ